MTHLTVSCALAGELDEREINQGNHMMHGICDDPRCACLCHIRMDGRDRMRAAWEYNVRVTDATRKIVRISDNDEVEVWY